MTELRIGDAVRYRTGTGFDPSDLAVARVVEIDLDGERLGSLPWGVVSNPLSGVFVGLDNGTQAYGDLLDATTEGRSSR